MRLIGKWTPILVCTLAAAAPVGAQAGSTQGSADASGSADIEMGATQPSEVELGAGAQADTDTSGGSPAAIAPTDGGSSTTGTSDLRLGLQVRLDAINLLGFSDPIGGNVAGGVGSEWRVFVPLVTPGVRFLEDRMFLGLGLGLAGGSEDNGADEDSRSAFSLSPHISYDIVREDVAALSLVGWLNYARLSETEDCDPGGCMDQNDDVSGLGITLGAGLRGLLSPGLALGGEFGWGFLDLSSDPGTDLFVHGLFGTLLVEASIGL